MNKAILTGTLGADPEVRTTATGKTVATFSIATKERFKDRTTGEKKEVTDWHNVVLWAPLSEIAAQYLRKGSRVMIEGKIKTRSYESAGLKKYITEIVGDNLELLSDRPTAQTPAMESSGAPADNSTDDLPF
jgi:single-strand DNA-binding protein